jgi:hypothetical protein
MEQKDIQYSRSLVYGRAARSRGFAGLWMWSRLQYIDMYKEGWREREKGREKKKKEEKGKREREEERRNNGKEYKK